MDGLGGFRARQTRNTGVMKVWVWPFYKIGLVIGDDFFRGFSCRSSRALITKEFVSFANFDIDMSVDEVFNLDYWGLRDLIQEGRVPRAVNFFVRERRVSGSTLLSGRSLPQLIITLPFFCSYLISQYFWCRYWSLKVSPRVEI